MTIVVISALLLAFAIYIAVGLYAGRKTMGIADMLPLGMGKQASVKNSAEFSSSTVATTISLATVVMAFFELAQTFGLWLFWTVLTTSLGLFVVRLFAGKIWHRMSHYDHRPTLHEFLGKEFDSELVSYAGAICTSLGFIGAFAIELTVGSRFFAWLVPGVSPWLVVVLLSAVALLYTSVGGFRAVIITDRIQMISIWLLLLALPLFYIYFAYTHGGMSEAISRIPAATIDFSYRDGLAFFMLGIFVINVPTFISDMSIWQRIAGAQNNTTVVKGLWSSVFTSAVTWSLFVLLACGAFMIVTPADGVNPLVSVLNVIGGFRTPLANLVLFLAVLGLYGAMLSTASTQLIAVSHTLYEDIFSPFRHNTLKQRLESKHELKISRSILIITAVASTLLVQLLSMAGFSIADLVFAIYGAQLGLCPLVIMALVQPRERLVSLSTWAALAICCGFTAGWTTAICGRLAENDSIVFMAPVASLVVSSSLLTLGIFTEKNRKPKPQE